MATATATSTPANVTSLKPRLQGRDVGIPVRKMGLSYSDEMPSDWFSGNPFLTMFFSGFSATLPEGEAQFIHSVRLFQEKLTDPVLLAQVRAFIGQEGHHSKEHDTLNDAMKQRGVDLGLIEKRMASMVNSWRQNLSPRQQLAMTVCAEHFTALLADYILSKNPAALEQMAPQARQIWAWHSIEEAEHKAVAFDVYMQLVGDRVLLRRTMVAVTAIFLSTSVANAFTLLPRRHLTNWRMWKEAGSLLREMGRASWADYKDFYRSDFHPWQHDNRDALKAARLKYLNEAP